MKHHYHTRHSILYHYILTYFLVFVIPLVLFSFIIYQQSVKIFSKQYIETAQAAAAGVSTNIRRMMDSAASTANIIRENPYFSSHSIKNVAGSFIYIDKTMNNMISLNNDFQKMAFYSAQNDLVYSDSINNREYYLKNVFQSQSITPQTNLKTILDPQWMPMENAKIFGAPNIASTLTFPIEYEIDDGKRTCNSLFFAYIDMAQIRQLLNPITAMEGIHAVVFYDKSPILSDELPILHYFQKQKENLKQNDFVSINQQKYLMRWTHQNEKISVLSLLPQKKVNRLASDIMLIYLLSLLPSIAVGAILVFLSAKHNYSPILQLLQKVSKAVGIMPEEINRLDEVRQTSYALDSLIKDKKQIEVDHYAMTLNHLLLRLLENSSKYAKSASFERHSKELNIVFDAKNYCCILLSQCRDRSALLQYINNEMVLPSMKAFAAGDIEDGMAVVLLCANADDDACVNLFIKQIDNWYDFAGIGRFVNEIESLTMSYKQAYYALLNNSEHKRINQYSTIQNIERNDVLTQFAKESELFSKAISGNQQSRMLLSLSHISDLLELVTDNHSVEMLLHHILFVAVKALAAANINFSQTIELLGSLPGAQQGESPKEWLNLLSMHLAQVLSGVTESSQSDNTKQHTTDAKDIQYILLYINSNYMKTDFSIKMLADELHMSVSNLSHYFKSRMNRNLSDYINDLRISEAKRLLCETDLKIADIAPHLGYLHISSFTKKFKQCTGQTPSEYKAANHNIK